MPGRRLASLRTAVLLAAGFILLRVVYRVVFGGASGGGTLLLDLPRVPLAGPFRHILLFGPVTSGGLAGAAQTALPFAAVILAFGLLGAIVDLRRLLTRGAIRGPLRSASRALVIAWGTFPALRDSVTRVRVARELRGERSIASVIVPVLEQTVERAVALGASMEVRGFAAERRSDPVCERPATLADAALGYEGRWTLEAIDLDFAPATLTLVTGATGAGKSTLLHGLSGLLQHAMDGRQRGLVEVAGVDRLSAPPRETAGFAAAVPQSVRLSFVAATVAEEIGFALAIRGVAPTIVDARVAETAAQLGIAHLLGREVGALSAGEACLVAIGGAIIAQPVLLLVDEPLADLDAAARLRVVGVLDRLAHEAGICVVVAEHRLDEWDGVADVRLELRAGAVRSVEPSAVRLAGPAGEPHHPPGGDGDPALLGEVVARIRGLSVVHGSLPAVREVSLELAAGELVALRGPNGAGKSSLLNAVARPTAAGVVEVRRGDVRSLRPRARRGAVALVPEAFDDLLFTVTVDDECRRADRRAASGSPSTAQTLARLLGRDGEERVGALRSRHPRDLSAGERLCLVMAIQLSARPAVLLVDEPTRGLDADSRRLVGDALLAAAAAGIAVVVATHDAACAARIATRTVAMTAGRIDEPRRAVSA